MIMRSSFESPANSTYYQQESGYYYYDYDYCYLCCLRSAFRAGDKMKMPGGGGVLEPCLGIGVPLRV